MKYTVNYAIQLINGDEMIERHGTMLANHALTEEELRSMKWEGTINKLTFNIVKIEVE